MASARGTTRTRARTPVVEQIVPSSGWTEDSAGHYLLVDLPEFRREEVKLQVDSSGRILVTGERQVNEWKHVHFRLTFPEPVDSDTDKITGKFDGGILYVTVPKQVKQNKESETARAGNGEVERAENYSHQHRNEVESAEIDSHHHENGEAERAEENDSNQHGNGKVETTEDNDSHATNVVEGRRDPSQHDNHTEQVQRNENEQIGYFPEHVIWKWEQESMLRSATKVLRRNKGIVITAVIAFSLGLLVSRKFNSTIT